MATSSSSESETVSALIERIVLAAHIVSPSEREDLRRELWTHFDDAANGPDGTLGAVERFGAEGGIAESLRRVYRWDYAMLYFGKIAVSVVACTAAALLIQTLVNLRVELTAEAWRLAPGFSHAAVLSVAVVLGFVTVWEVGRRPFNRRRAVIVILAYAALCVTFQLAAASTMGPFVTASILVGVGSVCSKLTRSLALLVALAGFAATLYIRHLHLPIDFGAERAALTGGVYVAVWVSTLAILGRLERAFGSMLGAAAQRAA